MSIKTKLTAVLLLIGIVPLVVVYVVGTATLKRVLHQETFAQLEAVAAVQEERLAAKVEDTYQNLALITSRTALRRSLATWRENGDPAALARINLILEDILPYADIRALYIMGPDGEMITNQPGLMHQADQVRALPKLTADAPDPYLAIRRDETASDELWLYAAGPLLLDGQFLGALVLQKPPDELLDTVASYAGLGETGETIVAEARPDGSARFLTPVRFDAEAAMRRIMPADRLDTPIIRALAEDEVLLPNATDYRGEKVLAVTRYLEDPGWGIVLKMDVAEAFAPLRRVERMLLWFIFAGSLAIAAISLWLARRGTVPLRRLKQGAEAVGRGDLQVRVKVEADDETEELARAFNTMVRDLQRVTASRDQLNHEIEERQQVEAALQERMKELACLQRVSALLAERDVPVEKVCQDIVSVIPPALHYPAAAWARLTLHGKVFASGANYASPATRLQAVVQREQEELGLLEVGYLDSIPEADHDPFLKEEQELLDSVAQALGHYLEQRHSLSRSETRFRQLLTLAPVPMMQVDGEGRILFLNQAFSTTFGYGQAELPDMEAWWERAYPETEYRQWVRQKWQSDVRLAQDKQQEMRERSYRVSCRDGGVRYVEVGGIAVGQEYLVLLIDRTQRHAAEEAQRKLTQELERKNDELGQVVYVASHDLRSPLVNVQGFSRELATSLEQVSAVLKDQDLPADAAERLRFLLEEDVPEALDFILRSTSQMDRLLTGLLKISRLGRAALSPVILDMTTLVRDVADSMTHLLREAGGTIEVDELPPCYGDAGQLEQVFMNLMQNAIKYAHPERPPTIRVTGQQTGSSSRYCVEDNGVGIQPEHQSKVFELFHRLDPKATLGEGLGLTIVRTILDRHGGQISLESQPGEGSRFCLELTASAADFGDTSIHATVHDHSPPPPQRISQ